MGDGYFEQQRRARAFYRCDLCGETIAKGAEYILCRQCTDGSWRQTRHHIHCDAFLNAYTTQAAYDGYYDADSTREWIEQEVCRKCPEYDAFEGCDRSEFGCERAMDALLHPTILTAAKESAQESRSLRLDGTRRG